MYRTDLINAAMGAQRMTNPQLAQKADLDPTTISKIRNGDPKVKLPSLSAVAVALGLSMEELFTPKPAPPVQAAETAVA